jgi:type I restriction enzyme, S subunit
MNTQSKSLLLGDIADFKSGGTPSKSNPRFWGGEYPWVSAKDLKSSEIVDSIDKLTKAGFEVSNIAPKDSILMLVRGMTLFKDVPICLAGKELAFNQDIKALEIKNGVVPLYLQYFLLSHKSKLLDLVDTAGHGTGRLDTEALKNIAVLVPSLPVQEAIASMLKTWDVAIEKTERLIAAKEKQLQWLRRQITTGKTRLPSSVGKWKKARLGEVLTEHGELSTGKEEVCSVSVHKGVINQIEHLGRVFAAKDTSNYNLVKPGDIIYTKSPTGNFPLGIIKQCKLGRNVIVSPLYGVFTPNSTSLGAILDCYFESEVNTKNYLSPIVQKGAKNTISITNAVFLSNTLFLPVDLQEQKRIAAILLAARGEIDLLKKKAEAYQKQKRGLMQKLLTGRWRLKN